MKQKVEIISATECKTVNPLGKEPTDYKEDIFLTIGGIAPFHYLLNNWQQAENKREVYGIVNFFQSYSDGVDIFYPFEPTIRFVAFGSLHEAEVVNHETKMAIIL